MPVNQLSKYRHIFIAIALFCLAFLLYSRSQYRSLMDSKWAIHIASSMINSGDINMDEYEPIVSDNHYSGTTRTSVEGQLLPYFPIGNSILIIPLVWIIEHTKQFPDQQSLYQYLQQTSPYDPYLVSIQNFAASLITALAAPILYSIGRKQFNHSIAIMGVLIFAFATPAYSTASRVLWQHGPSMLMLTIALALFIKGESQPRAVQWAGIPLAFSFVIRPTNSIPIILFTIVMFLRYRKQLPGYLFGAMVVAVPFFWSNQLIYNHFLPPYYQPQRIGSSPYFLEALVGNLVSPSRGLFVFSPVLLVAVYGIFAKFRRARLTLLEGALFVIIGLHWIAISSFEHWWGGGSYGPRFFTDILPYLTYFLFMGLNELNLPTTRDRVRQIGMSIFIVLAFFSIAIHYVGANRPIVGSWSRWPADIDTYPSIRLWDWQDLLFFRTVDDWPLSTLPANITFDLQDDQADELRHIPLHNTAKNDYYWEVKLPSSLRIDQIAGISYAYTESGIPTVVGETALSSGDYQWLPIALERPLDSFAEPSLGAVMITTRTSHGEVQSVQVVPGSVINNGRHWHESDAFSSQVWLPADIRVNGGKADPTLYGFYGPGWYALESLEPYHWRWAQSPAELYIFSASPRTLTLELAFNSLHDKAGADRLGDTGQLHILVGEENWTGQVKTGEFRQIPLSLDKGWNTLVFHLESGNFSPADVDATSSDRRRLSFSLESINMVTNGQ